MPVAKLTDYVYLLQASSWNRYFTLITTVSQDFLYIIISFVRYC